MDRRQMIAGLSGLAAFGAAGAGAQTLSQDELKKRREEFEALEAQYRTEMLAQFPYPLVKCAGVDALAKWSELRTQRQSYPVIIGDAEKLARLADMLLIHRKDGRTPQVELEKAATFRYPEDYKARLQAEAETFRQQFPELAKLPEAWRDPTEDSEPDAFQVHIESWGEYVSGQWPDALPGASGPSVVNAFVQENGEFVSRPAPEVYITILPTADWTEAFAYLGFGGWNANPYPHEHVAAFRRWNAKYNLELIGMSNDVLDLRCRSRARDRVEAMTLAREQFELCPDLLEQGDPSAEALAVLLMDDEWWNFWWD